MNTISPEVKTALVTGTDHGVGFSLAKKLLARGYFVIAVRIDETEKQIDALQSLYPNQMAIVCADIGSDESVFKASNDARDKCKCHRYTSHNQCSFFTCIKQ